VAPSSLLRSGSSFIYQEWLKPESSNFVYILNVGLGMTNNAVFVGRKGGSTSSTEDWEKQLGVACESPRTPVIGFGTTYVYLCTFATRICSIHFSNIIKAIKYYSFYLIALITASYGRNSAVHMLKYFSFWGTSSPGPVPGKRPTVSINLSFLK